MDKEVSIKFWKLPGEHRPVPRLNNGTREQMITADVIVMKILPEMYLWKRKSFIKFWKLPGERRPLPRPNNTPPDQIITTDWIFMTMLPEMYFWTRKFVLNFASYPENADPCRGQTISHLIS